MLTRTCALCGVEFQPRPHASAQKYCESCIPEARRKRQRIDLPSRNCDRCSVPFEPYSGGQKFCAGCRDEAGRDRKRVKPDQQMDKLFAYYQSHESVVIDDAPEGSKVVVLSDLQIPFVDEELEAARDQFIREWKPDYIFYNGDCLDAYELSSFDKNPHRIFGFSDEREQARKMLHHHKNVSGAKLYWIDGNHEDRLQRIIWKHAQGFADMVDDLPKALELDKWCEAYVPYGKHVEFLGFIITHGTIVRSNSGYTAKAMLDKYHSSGCSGHTHRIGSHSSTDHRGVSHTWYEIGYGARKDLEYTKAPADWQQGFLIGKVMGGAIHPQLVRVIETKKGRGFVADGAYYKVG